MKRIYCGSCGDSYNERCVTCGLYCEFCGDLATVIIGDQAGSDADALACDDCKGQYPLIANIEHWGLYT